MRSSLRLGLAMTVAILTCHVVYAQTTYYVATNGTDAASGLDWANALLTISNAVARAIASDTVTVSNGTYNITTLLSQRLSLDWLFATLNGWSPRQNEQNGPRNGIRTVVNLHIEFAGYNSGRCKTGPTRHLVESTSCRLSEPQPEGIRQNALLTFCSFCRKEPSGQATHSK